MRVAGAVLLIAMLGAEVRAEDVAELAALLGTDRGREAAAKLAGLGPAAKDAVPQLAHALGSSDGGLRWRAAWALSRIGPDAAPAARELAEKVVADHGMPSAAARIALRRIGPRATGAVMEALASAPERFTDAKPYRSSQSNLLKVFLEFDLDPEAAVPPVLRILDNEDARDEALALLARMGPGASAAGPALAARFRALPEKDAKEAHLLLDTLVASGEPGVATLSELAQASLTDERRGSVIGALARIPGPGTEAARKLLETTAIKPELEGVLLQVAKAGPHAADLVPLLEAKIAHWRAPPGSAAALLALGERGKEALEKLIFKSDKEIRTELAKQLCKEEWEFGGPDPDGRPRLLLLEAHRGTLVPWLLKLGQPKDPADAKVEILRALAGQRLAGADARAAVILASQHVKSEPPAVAMEACRLAGSLGPLAASLADRLRAMVKEADPDVIVAAAATLCEIGKGGPKQADELGRAIVKAITGKEMERVRRLLEWLPRDCPPPPERCVEITKSLLPKVRPISTVGVDDWYESEIAARTLAYLLPGLPAAERGPVLAALRTEYRTLGLATWSLARAGEIDNVAELIPVSDLTAAALEGIAAAPRSPWKALASHLAHADPEVRQFAARGLLRLDPAKAGEEACLLGLGDDESSSFDEDLVAEYRKLAPSPVPMLRKGLSSDNATIRCRSAVMLGALGDRDAIPAIRAALEDEERIRSREVGLRVLDSLLAE